LPENFPLPEVVGTKQRKIVATALKTQC
jgi:hypothetical protein